MCVCVSLSLSLSAFFVVLNFGGLKVKLKLDVQKTSYEEKTPVLAGP